MILDSDHAKAHVLRELEALTPLLRKGDYLVVEDTCVNGHPVRPQFGPGPYEAVEEFMARRAGEYVHDVARESKFGFTAAPRGYFPGRANSRWAAWYRTGRSTNPGTKYSQLGL